MRDIIEILSQIAEIIGGLVVLGKGIKKALELAQNLCKDKSRQGKHRK